MILNALLRLGGCQRPCLLCRGWSSQPLCPACTDDLPWVGLPSVVSQTRSQGGAVCPVHAAFYYRYPVDRAITEFKAGGRGHLLHGLLGALRVRPGAIALEPVDRLLLVPSSSAAAGRRRWDLSQAVARILLAESAGSTRVSRVNWQAGRSQRGLRGQARRQSGRRFGLPGMPPGSRVGLVDDICTTGATLTALAEGALAAGALPHWAWVLAYTEAPLKLKAQTSR